MISYIRGELCDIEEQKAIVDVNGVGYWHLYATSRLYPYSHPWVSKSKSILI